MKRPHSAKPSAPQWALRSQEDALPLPSRQVQPNRKYLFQGVSNSNKDLSRILPKRIPHDKQRLYQEALQLKHALNQVSDQNHRLKTKIAVLERQHDGQRKASKNNIKNQKENGLTDKLKRMLRQSHEQQQRLNSQLTALKKTVKFSKLNEAEIQRKTLLQQNKRLVAINLQLQEELSRRQNNRDVIQELKREIKTRGASIRDLTNDNIKYEQLLQGMQMSNRQLVQKLQVQLKKQQRNRDIQKRKDQQASRNQQRLRQEVQTLKKELQQARNNQQKIQQQAKNSRAKVIARPHTAAPKNNQEKQQALQQQKQLQKQVQEARKQLKASQNVLSQSQNPDKTFLLELTQMDHSRNTTQQVTQKSYEKQSKKPSKRMDSALIKEIRQLLTCRMKYNRYTFDQLRADFSDYITQNLSRSDVLATLSSQPFCLDKHYATQFLNQCYLSLGLSVQQHFSGQDFMDCLRQVINDFVLLQEQQEQRMLYKIADYMTKQRSKLIEEFKKNHKNATVSKIQVAKILGKVGGLSSQQIDLAICYISMHCLNLSSINFYELLDKFYISNNSKSLSADMQVRSKQRIEQGSDESLSLGGDEDGPVHSVSSDEMI